MTILPLPQSILFTISYFNTFDYPVTFFEVWKYLYKNEAKLEEVIDALDKLVAAKTIETKNGFYFIPGSDGLVDKKQRKYDISEKFWNKAIFAAKILTFIPFIRGVFVVNSLAFFNCEKDSDIDFLIITKKGKIWTARALSSTLLQILGMRRHGKKVAKRICLSFYVSESKMNLDYLAKDELGFFVAYWISQSTPLVNKDRAFERFRKENDWTKEILPNSDLNYSNYYIDFKYPLFAKIVAKALEIAMWPGFIENIARAIQNSKIRNSQKKWGQPSSVICNDEILKFHPVDLRIEYKETLDNALAQFKDVKIDY